MSDISQDTVDEIYQERIKNLKEIKNFERKYMKKKIPKKEQFIRWLIKRWLPGYHLHKSPLTKKIKESQPSASSMQIREEDSGPEPVRMED